MLVTLTEAARLGGVSRTTLYKKYIDTGKITVDKTDPKQPRIDTSELLRVFGILQGENTALSKIGHSLTAENSEKIMLLEQNAKHLVQLLQEKDNQIEMLEKNNADLRLTVKLLENKQAVPEVKEAHLEVKSPAEKIQAPVQESAPPAPKQGLVSRFKKWLNS